jgi:hypothetical protein
LTGCRSKEDRVALKSALDEINGYTTDDTDYTLSTGTSIANQEIYRANGITLTALGVSQDYGSGFTVTLLLQNESQEDVQLRLNSTAVNGWVVDGWMSCDLDAGDAAKETVSISSSSLIQTGFEDLYTLSFQFYLYDEDYNRTVIQWDTQSDAQGTPNGPDLSGAQVLYEDDNITISCLGLASESYSPAVYFYLENHSRYTLCVSNDDEVTLNGDTELDGWFYSVLPPETQCIESLPLYNYQLEEAGLDYEDLYLLDTEFEIKDYDSYYTLASGTISASLGASSYDPEADGITDALEEAESQEAEETAEDPEILPGASTGAVTLPG